MIKFAIVLPDGQTLQLALDMYVDAPKTLSNNEFGLLLHADIRFSQNEREFAAAQAKMPVNCTIDY